MGNLGKIKDIFQSKIEIDCFEEGTYKDALDLARKALKNLD